ncbi:hypothetical protein ISF_02858 [Cordyceps fumosorosea ARSEF 2679]|uniref:Uncharacterized protein n=1 Tax=Cordyceps fumosorosea (strain ARSEF 2679) TaxID=1081104 RepID=A0A168B3Z7_CORFA|nr:hypothetical protein ISF_02858 [Cordyceps fumosorosea ARSEF 2679]OAA69588.1 hypothetical protein ISF_02858 [Cordyceps fumosorosea ARSEF 2679]
MAAAAAAKEETFRNYDDDQQAESYARHRPARLHTAPRCTRPLLRFHQSTGGREALLSRPSAAGPGQRNPCPRPATSHAGVGPRRLARPWRATSRGRPEPCAAGATTQDRRAAPSFADRIYRGQRGARTGSTCPAFLARAALQALRPGGTVALWIPGERVVHPSTPGAPALGARSCSGSSSATLLPHCLPGNLLFRNRYRSLAAAVDLGPADRGLRRGRVRAPRGWRVWGSWRAASVR